MLDRRDVLRMGAGFLALAGVAHAADQPTRDPAGVASALAKAIGECVIAGNACLDHCLMAFSSGDTSLAECASNVRDMLAICAAAQTLVAGSSMHSKSAVKLCLDICADCERACRKHESQHAICKRCADACAAVVKTAREFLA